MSPVDVLNAADPLALAGVGLLIAIGVALLVLAALHDVAARTVPNALATALAVAGLGLQASQGDLALAIAVAALVFIAAAVCWRRGWMGGGDVKLLGAAALLVSPAGVPPLLLATALSGGLLAMPYLVARRRLARPGAHRPRGLVRRAVRAERWRLRRGGPMPYAVAIGLGAVFALSNQFMSLNGASP